VQALQRRSGLLPINSYLRFINFNIYRLSRFMPLERPSIEDLATIAQAHHLNLSEADLAEFQTAITLESHQRIDQLINDQFINSLTESSSKQYPRDAGYRPSPEDNPYNAWYWKTAIQGAKSGLLQGKTVAIKDNICVAGVPMMNGSSLLEGYVPEIDATIVTRILDAGGEITGKAVCESLCSCGSSFTAATGAVRNPYDETRSAGGSSSGCGALVAGGIVDMAIGGDQGGSIRIPASWCGIVGLKPTWGLVPYTGICPVDVSLDHTGPMARTVADVALLLETIAGPDSLDPRQYQVQMPASYTAALVGHAKGIKVGILQEGFDWAISEPDVDQLVRTAAYRLKDAGAIVEKISIPLHRDGAHIAHPIFTEGATATILNHGMTTGWKGQYLPDLMQRFAERWAEYATELSAETKLEFLIGQYMRTKYHGLYYAKAQHLSRILKAAYDKALEQFDVLVMPTLPMKATKLPAADASILEQIARSDEMCPNTAPFDITGHPAISVNAGMSAGLPVGIMFVSRCWDEATLLQVAHAFEQVCST
jgi:amidase